MMTWYTTNRVHSRNIINFFGAQFQESFLVASEGSRGRFWDAFWRVPGPLFLASDRGFVQQAKTCSFSMFFGAKSKCLHLQNHANRTVHPSKIEGVLAMV